MRKILKIILIIGAITLGLSYIFNPYSDIHEDNGKQVVDKIIQQQEIPLNTLVSKYRNNEFQELEIIGDEKLVGKTVSGTQFLINSASLGGEVYERQLLTFTSNKPANTSLLDLGITLSGQQQTGGTIITVVSGKSSGFVSFLLEDLLPALAVFALFLFLLTKMGPKGGMSPFGMKIGILNKKDDISKPSTTFNDVAGMDEVKQELAEIVDFLKNPDKYRKVGARIPKGVLLYGSPGGGKTLLARAVAGEANVPFYSASGSEFMEMLVGMGAAKVRELFGKAKASSPSIIFIDEIDAIGKKRGAGHTGGHQEQEQTLNQILTEMDGFEQGTSVIVIAATNRPDTLDPALLRSGRFDRKVLVSNPTFEERLEIIRYYLKNKQLEEGYNIESLARRLSGFVGADIENIINEAALKVARDDRTHVSEKDLEYGFEKTLMGPEKKIKTLKEQERKVVTYHELGHAIVAYMLPNGDPVEKISIVSRGMALGVTRFSQEEDSYLKSKAKFLDDIAASLGGRAAEEVFFGKENITTGASNDFEKVTKAAYDMITKYGMLPQIGTVNFSQEEYLPKPYSEKTAETIDALAKEIIDTQYQVALQIIQNNKDNLNIIADVLYKKEYLTKEEFEQLMTAGDDLRNIADKMLA